MTTTRVYQLPFDGWVIDIADGKNLHTGATFPPGAVGLSYLDAFLKGYFSVKAPRQ
jgi:hypothetical protein